MTLICVLTQAFGLRPFGAAIGDADAILFSLRFAAVEWSRRSGASVPRIGDKPGHRWQGP